MNYGQFYANRDQLYSGGMRWWIEHDAPIMRAQMIFPAGSAKPAHYKTRETLPSRALDASDEQERDIQDFAQRTGANGKHLMFVLNKLTRLGHLIRTGAPGYYKYRRQT